MVLFIRRGSAAAVSQSKLFSSTSSSHVSNSQLPNSTVSSYHDHAANKPEGPSASDVWPAEDYVCPFHNLPTEWWVTVLPFAWSFYLIISVSSCQYFAFLYLTEIIKNLFVDSLLGELSGQLACCRASVIHFHCTYMGKSTNWKLTKMNFKRQTDRYVIDYIYSCFLVSWWLDFSESMAVLVLMLCTACRSEMQQRNDKLEFERNKERLLFMKVSFMLCCI